MLLDHWANNPPTVTKGGRTPNGSNPPATTKTSGGGSSSGGGSGGVLDTDAVDSSVAYGGRGLLGSLNGFITSDEFVNSMAGFGDALLIGFGDNLRSLLPVLGLGNNVDMDSASYKSGFETTNNSLTALSIVSGGGAAVAIGRNAISNYRLLSLTSFSLGGVSNLNSGAVYTKCIYKQHIQKGMH